MGKGKGKKGKKDPKSAIKKSTEITKVKAPRPVNPIKKAKKLMSKDKKAERDAIPPIGSDMDAIRKAASDRVMKNLLHAKWPALFKKHLGVIESHILALDRTMMSMKTEMEHMPEKQRLEWELGERGNFRVLCEMMDRARQVLVDARRSAQGIVSSHFMVNLRFFANVHYSYHRRGCAIRRDSASRARNSNYWDRNLRRKLLNWDTRREES
jgi:hypothetical protein